MFKNLKIVLKVLAVQFCLIFTFNSTSCQPILIFDFYCIADILKLKTQATIDFLNECSPKKYSEKDMYFLRNIPSSELQIRTGISQEDNDQYSEIIRRAIAENIQSIKPVYVLSDYLIQLQNSNYCLGIIGESQELIERFLDNNKIAHLFDQRFICIAEPGKKGEAINNLISKFENNFIAYVGDSIDDFHMIKETNLQYSVFIGNNSSQNSYDSLRNYIACTALSAGTINFISSKKVQSACFANAESEHDFLTKNLTKREQFKLVKNFEEMVQYLISFFN